jgi:ABC-type microcin C transport system duplicated ATPase subunit YejF
MESGRIVETGSVSAVFGAPRTTAAKELIGG